MLTCNANADVAGPDVSGLFFFNHLQSADK